MLLNKISVLDKGYVAFISSSNNIKTMNDIQTIADVSLVELSSIASLTVAIKCPLFVQLFLSKFQLKMFNMSVKEAEAFMPDLTDVNCSDHEMGAAIADDMKHTTEALLINPKAYQKDGCDYFTSQIITPISVYNELVVHGTLEQWVKLVNVIDVPKPIRAYCDVINEILINEWKILGYDGTDKSEKSGTEEASEETGS